MNKVSNKNFQKNITHGTLRQWAEAKPKKSESESESEATESETADVKLQSEEKHLKTKSVSY